MKAGKRSANGWQQLTVHNRQSALNSASKIGYVGVVAIKQHKTSDSPASNCNASKIGYVGVVAIKQHKTSDSHASNCNASNSLIDQFFVEVYAKPYKIIASEVAQK